MAIPTHLICGPLGVGKTTAIIDYLRRHAATEFTAVMVNDFGPVGLDAAIVDSDTGGRASVQMLPGGCVCCTAAAGFVGALEEMAQRPEVTRLLIEPSGMAMVGDMVDLLRSISAKYRLDLRPVVVLVEPRLLERAAFHKAPYYTRMVEAADVLVANRSDLATLEQRQAFEQWAAALQPPKLRVIQTEQGKLPDEIFELRYQPQAHFSPATRGHQLTDHWAGGTLWPCEVRFSYERTLDRLGEWARTGLLGRQVLRFKGLMHTDEGWRLLEIAQAAVHQRPTDYRRDNRADWICTGAPILDEAIRAELEACAL